MDYLAILVGWMMYIIGYHYGKSQGKKAGALALAESQRLAAAAAGELRRAKNLVVSARYSSGNL